MSSFPRVDRGGVAFSLLVLALVGGWYLLAPAAFRDDVRGPQTYIVLAFVALLLVANTFEGVRESWLYGLLFGAFTLAWGVHNLSGPEAPYLTGYGFVVLGLAGIVYAVYRRVRPHRRQGGA